MIIGLSGSAGCGKDTVADLLVEYHGFVKVAMADAIKRAAMEWWSFSELQLWGPSEERNKPDPRYRLQPNNYKGSKISGISAEDVRNFEDQQVFEQDGPFLTPRHALQQIGTEVARAIDPDVWVRYTMQVANRLLEDPRSSIYVKTEGVVERFEATSMGEWERDEAPEGASQGVVIPDCRFLNEFQAIRAEKGKLIRITRAGSGLRGRGAQHLSETQQQQTPDSYFDRVLENDGTLNDLKNEVEATLELWKNA